MRTYHDDWPVHIVQVSTVVRDRVGIPSCEACGHRFGGHQHYRYCGNCGRTLNWRPFEASTRSH